MSHEDACRTLDETGMLQAFQLPSDRVGEEMQGNRLGFGNRVGHAQLHISCLMTPWKRNVFLDLF